MDKAWNEPKSTKKRIVVYPKDIMFITGRSERYSREVIKRIREHV
jgi:hypothetical protein